MPQEIRLAYENINENKDPTQKLWLYQTRHHSKDLWVPAYCFTELEFLPQDYEIMNFWTSQSRKIWFTHRVVVAKMILSKERVLSASEDDIVGTLTLSGEEVKKTLHGRSEIVAVCRTEDERLKALVNWFGIYLKLEEENGIRGKVTALPAA